jgi:hypothetical protein
MDWVDFGSPLLRRDVRCYQRLPGWRRKGWRLVYWTDILSNHRMENQVKLKQNLAQVKKRRQDNHKY